jgi:thioredoxin reductase (NADPH)
VCFNTVIKEIRGEQKVKSVVLSDTLKDKTYEEQTDAVFIFAGTVPQSSFLQNSNFKVDTDENGYIITDKYMASNVPGLFAAGDIRRDAFRQVITAAADGAAAAHYAYEYIDELNIKVKN